MPVESSCVAEVLEARRLFAVGDAYVPPADPRQTVDLDGGWKFSLGSGTASPDVSDAGWADVALPHTWNALDGQNGGNNYARTVGWYRRPISAPAGADGDTLTLRFEGAGVVAKVYVDGKLLGTHAGAFAAFDVDVTNALADGRSHLLAVQCDNSLGLGQTVAPTDGADFNVDGGLYRGVSLLAVDGTHLSTDDAASGVQFTTTSASAASAGVRVQASVDSDVAEGVVVRSVLVDAGGRIVGEASGSANVAAGGTATLVQTATVDRPHLWNGTIDPYLHSLYVEVRDKDTGKLLDLVEQNVGIRSFKIDPAKGFLLNGSAYDLHGTMYHANAVDKGRAIDDAQLRADFATLLEMGVTAVRTHYQASPLFYDLADAAGLVVMSEVAFNGSQTRAMTVSADAFTANAKQQLRELVRQNYNRAGVVSWGLYNELVDSAGNRAIVAQLNAYAHTLDSTRVTTGASWNTAVGGLEKSTDVVEYNRYFGWYSGSVADAGPFYDKLHAANPATAIGVSEFGAGSFITQHGKPEKVTSNGYWQSEEYQSTLYEGFWPQLASRPYLWAKMHFDLFDFTNDQANNGPTPGIRDFGVITADRATKKDGFYYFKANWSKDPVLRLTSSRWTTRDTSSVEVKAYANVDGVRLSVNGVDYGPLTDRGYGVFSLPAVPLVKGKNVLVVTGTRDGRTFSDTATWTCTTGSTTPPPPPVTPTGVVSGYVFADADKDGLFDNGEAKSAGVTVFVDADNDGALDNGEASVVTTADGGFAFTQLAAGTYRLRVVLPANTAYSTAAADVAVTDGQQVTGVAIGTKSLAVVPPPAGTATIRGNAFNDNNANGKFDAGDGNSKGVRVFLDDDNDGVWDNGELSVLADTSGKFAFANLAAGTYRVRRVFDANTALSTPPANVVLTNGQTKSGVLIGGRKA